METNSLLLALGLLLFGGGEDKATPSISKETYITSTDSHCKIHNPYPQPNETVSWSGACINGFANGKGRLQWYENGKKTDVFIGYYSNGKRQKQGKYIWANGDVYQGDWLDDKQNGKGKHIQKSGTFYQGSWFNDCPNGFGKSTFVKHDKNLQVWKDSGLGNWQGDMYIVQGIFECGILKIECSSPKDCQKKQANQK